MRYAAPIGFGLVALSAIAGAQSTTPYDFHKGTYPQFRNLSGLAGSAFGTDQEGYLSLTGPVAFSTPTAYVLGRNLFQAEVGATSENLAATTNSKHYNGSAFLMGGTTIARRINVAGTFFVKSSTLDQVFNLQLGYVPARNTPIAFSLGVQDMQGRGGSAGENLPSDHLSSRSIFGVATYRLDTRANPVFISAGFGEHRFSGGFASLSYQFHHNIRGYAEADGYGVNEGLVFAWKLGTGRHAPIGSANVGLARGERLSLNAGIGF